jgi:hypothetical protein
MASRRDFLKSLVALAAAGASFHPLQLLAGTPQERNCLIVGSDTSACLVDLEKFTAKRVDIGMRAHSFIPHPHNPMRFIAVEKWGPSSAEVDFEKSTKRLLIADGGEEFYGHGLYVKEKKAIFITRIDNAGLGYLTGYDPETYKILHNFQVTAGGLHECHRMADNSVMIASAGSRRPYRAGPREPWAWVEHSALVRVDMLNGGKELGRLSIEDKDQVVAHFVVTRAGQILALSGPTPGVKRQQGDLFYSPDGIQPLRRLDMPADMPKPIRGEMLSVALNADHSRAVVTNPGSEQVILVDMKEGKTLKVLPQPSKNMAFDPVRNKFIGGNKWLSLMDTAFDGQTKQSLADNILVDGAHSIIEQLKG